MKLSRIQSATFLVVLQAMESAVLLGVHRMATAVDLLGVNQELETASLSDVHLTKTFVIRLDVIIQKLTSAIALAAVDYKY